MTGSYRDRVAAALGDGWRFAGLHATSDGAFVRTLLAAPDGSTRLETVEADDGRVPSIVDLAPAAGWDEREAHDLQGVRFAGHEPLRPLIDHDLRLERWTVPVRGTDPYQVAVGPIHAGVIESGHFRFHVVGERILHLDARLFYKHRGLERAAEGKTLEDGLAYASRACAACAVTNGVAYAHACEEALGLRPTAELARARTILLELERMWSHLNDIAAVCAGVGLAAGNNAFAALTERSRRLNAALTGHRFLFGSVRVGGTDLTLDHDAVRDARQEVERFARTPPAPGASSSSTLPSRTGSRTSASSRRSRRRASAPSGQPRARPGSPTTSARTARASPTTTWNRSCRDARPATSRRGSSKERSSSYRRSACSRPCSKNQLRLPLRSRPTRKGRSASVASRARAARQAASSSGGTIGSSGCACGRARTRTGPPSPRPRWTTSFRTSP